jgi:Rne/Rng family ribonuclease
MNKMLIHTSKKEEVHIAVIDAQKHQLLGFHIESNSNKVTMGNIYLGIICRIERSLNAAFINYGGVRDGFLSLKELHPEYGEITIGQKVIIQIAKEPRDTKGAYLTTYLSFSGYYLVYFPNKEKKHGISRKIVDAQRKSVQKILAQIHTPGGHVICRTIASDRQEGEIFKEFIKLKELWETIRHKAKLLKHPKVLYDEHNLANTIIREYIRSDVENVQIDDKQLYKAIVSEIKTCSPLFEHKIHHYQKTLHIFEHYRVHKQIHSLFSREVRLKSGGSLILEQTEALMSIDVNSKHSTKSENVEETAFHTNAEAAQEIFKQIICRNLSGIIIVDFIDMMSKSNRTAIEELFLSLAQQDRLRMQITRISKLGIMEISRQRISSINTLGNHETCKACQGTGKVMPVDLPTTITHAVDAYVKNFRPKTLYLTLPANRIIQLHNHGMDAILNLQKIHRLNLIILHSTVLSGNQFNINTHILGELIPTHANNKVSVLYESVKQRIRQLGRLASGIQSFFFGQKSNKEDSTPDYKRSIRLHSTPSLMDYDEVEDNFPVRTLPSTNTSDTKVTGQVEDVAKSTATATQPIEPTKPTRTKRSTKGSEPIVKQKAGEDKEVKVHQKPKILDKVPAIREITSVETVPETPTLKRAEVVSSSVENGWQEYITTVNSEPLLEKQLVHKKETALIKLVSSKEVQEVGALVSASIMDPLQNLTPIFLRLGVDIHYHPTLYYANLCLPKLQKS